MSTGYTKTLGLLLRSLNPITKETPIVAMILGRASPDPGLGAMIELSSGNARGLLNLSRVGKTLPSQRITTIESPPAFLQIEPARAFGNEDVMQARMLSQEGPRLRTVVATQIISDDEDVTRAIVGFNVLQESDVVGGVA